MRLPNMTSRQRSAQREPGAGSHRHGSAAGIAIGSARSQRSISVRLPEFLLLFDA